ncbi:putative hydroquinone glucosyltransferase [Rosa chinensis]|uniref:Glycosyltransferase n=1 Tax=Rosa chinensis TaxID=74649 RepID=A0A2P6SIC7_ROSCH|nr:putative hydroquinone glucosyltransferase [Rosa chinensis]
MAQVQTAHIAILPSPGMGHLIPLAELAKQLVHRHNFTVTFIIPGDGPPTKAQKSVLDALPPAIDHVFLPPVSFDDLPGGSQIETLISLTVSRSLPYLRNALESLMGRGGTKLVGLVVDLFGTDAFELAREFNIFPYIFFCSTAMALSLFFYLPKLDESVSCEYRELKEPVTIPGCPGAIKALQEKEPGKPPVYPVGPLVKMDFKAIPDDGSSNSKCLKWLDDQPRGSVLFVSFGSGGTLSYNQINELALGLEMSEQRFLWVVRSPSDQAANATYFSAQSQDDPLAFLPKGFQERTRGRGLVVPNWAPQAQILGHESTGGFLTHCGWNSALESVANGVPLIAWPLYAEQKMNAIMFTHDIKVALRPRANENGFVEREEVAVLVKGLMEGEEGKRLRNRMKDLKDAATKSLSDEGASTKALSDAVTKWKTLVCN